jgi:hypothetical protein
MFTRSYYEDTVSNFISTPSESIYLRLLEAHTFSDNERQNEAWKYQISHLQKLFTNIPDGYIFFEFRIPRMGKRADVILIWNGIIFVIEYKVNSRFHDRSAKDQAVDYALDLKNFHEGSHEKRIIPILVATDSNHSDSTISFSDDLVASTVKTNSVDLLNLIIQFSDKYGSEKFSATNWASTRYLPTPTICEAAQALYAKHSVDEITRTDANAKNLSLTSNSINEIIQDVKRNKTKAICFLTGVPGSGKTLAGLNIAHATLIGESPGESVFLSGNGPLVKVLQQVLINDVSDREKKAKKDAAREVKTFIQNVHEFRDEYVRDLNAPANRIAIFDEAQRAWNKHKASNFMAKRGHPDFNQSEPEFLISVMDRHEDWAVIICVIGGGQEINDGEGGVSEWLNALKYKPSWNIYISDQLQGSDHFAEKGLSQALSKINFSVDNSLHLSTSVRSFRTESLSKFIHQLLEKDKLKARDELSRLSQYPVCLTRDLNKARRWLKSKARGTERYGIIASSKAQRLRAEGISVKDSIEPEVWFLAGKSDVRSSYALEMIATEFDAQGLELDWACLAWDANLYPTEDGWCYREFKGSKWSDVKKESNRLFLLNAYRVLLTRARQGLIIFVPKGSDDDPTRPPENYEAICEYLTGLGIPEVE